MNPGATPPTCKSGTCTHPQMRRQPTFPCEPETVELDLRGEKAVFDVNGLKLLGPRDAPARARPNFARVAPNISKLTLEVTHRCNLGCRYCFVREQYADDQVMSLRIAQTAFKRLLPRDRDVGVAFFGGEPLMAWDLIAQFMPWAVGVCSERQIKLPNGKTRSQRCRCHVTTNGTLLSPQRIEFLRRYGSSFIISLDGPREVHDLQRPFRRGDASSYEATLKALKLVGAAGLGKHTTIRATYDLASIRDAEPTWLAERLAHLVGLCRLGCAVNVSVEPAFASCGDIACIRENADGEHVKLLETAYWLAADLYVREHRAGRPFRFFHFDKFLERVRSGVAQPSECGAGYGVVSISPNGTICACHRETGTAIGHVDDGIDELARAPWLDNRLYARQGCLSCWARYLCGGGCRMDSLLHLNDIHRPCPWECDFKQMMIRIALWIDRQLQRGEE